MWNLCNTCKFQYLARKSENGLKNLDQYCHYEIRNKKREKEENKILSKEDLTNKGV